VFLALVRCPSLYFIPNEEAVIEPLKEVFNEVSKLPEDEQMPIAEIIKEELASDRLLSRL